jgi:DNA modification methylase
MKPENPWLMQGDCLDRMKEIPDASVDLVCCDLPYGTTQCKWDMVIPFEPLWEHYKRVVKNSGCLVFTSCQPFTSVLVMSNRKWFRFDDVWEKSSPTGHLDAKKRPLRCHESIVVFSPRPKHTYNPQMTNGKPNHVVGKNVGTRRNDTIWSPSVYVESDTSGLKYPRSVVRFPKHSSTENLHKSQKPLGLIEYLIYLYSNPGDTVLDNSMGSGTTICAAFNLGRKAIGIEKDQPIFDLAQNRIQDHMNGVVPKPKPKRETGTMVPLLKGFE